MNRISFILTILFASVASVVRATEDSSTPNAIVVHQTNGDVAVFAFAEQPQISYSDNELVVQTTRNSVRFPISKLRKLSFDFAEINTGIDELEAKPETHYRFKAETLSIVDGKPYALVFVYNMSGSKVAQFKLDGDGNVDIPLSLMNKGIYIVKVDSFSFKFRKL